MPINIQYIEEAESMQGLLIVEDPIIAGSKQEFRLPKFILDLVRSGIQNNTINMTTLWSRETNITKAL